MKLIILSAVIGACAAGLLPGYLPPNSAAAPTNNYLPPVEQSFRSSGQEYNSRSRAALDRNAAILRSDAETNEHGFHFAYETENGIQAQEQGQEADGIQSQGGYSYTGDDGQVYSVQYTAGAGGFQVQGAHIPTPPPVPAEIAKALQQNAADEANGIFDDGSYKGEGAGAAASSNAGYSYTGPTAAPAVIAARTLPSRQYLTPQSGFRSQSGYHY